MPFKHQGNAYRMIAGRSYECDGDICDESKGALRDQAKARVAELESTGRKAFFRTLDGFCRVFVETKPRNA